MDPPWPRLVASGPQHIRTQSGTDSAKRLLRTLQRFACCESFSEGVSAGFSRKPLRITITGGAQNAGVLFQVTPGGQEADLYSYRSSWPQRSGLTMDAAGNLYGTFAYGGAHNGGGVYEISGATEGAKKRRD